MDYLQYLKTVVGSLTDNSLSFKPCYKWITFNTWRYKNGNQRKNRRSFKPCYKWITFNTDKSSPSLVISFKVLNLVINGLPSIQSL